MMEGEERAGVDTTEIVPPPLRQARLEARREPGVGVEPGQVPSRRPGVSEELEIIIQGARDHVLAAGLHRRRRLVARRDTYRVAGIEVEIGRASCRERV